VSVANNGQDACEKLQLQPGYFDAVLMDVQMPIMDGYEATRRIRSDLGLLDLPIIALTAGALSSERQRATAVGMDDFIIKPFDAATLIASVMRHTVGARVRAGEVHAKLQSTPKRLAWTEIDGIDVQDARNRLCDDPELFYALLQRFLSDFSDMAVAVSRSVPRGLAEQADRLHKLVGAAGILGAKAIHRLAAEAEAACVAGDAARAGERSNELFTQMDALRLSAARVLDGVRPARQ
jgi:CheY-like chemotaxis protein